MGALQIYTDDDDNDDGMLQTHSVAWWNEFWRWFRPPLGKKRRILRNSRPCDQNCGRAGWSRLKALTVNMSRPSDRHGLYASFSGHCVRSGAWRTRWHAMLCWHWYGHWWL